MNLVKARLPTRSAGSKMRWPLPLLLLALGTGAALGGNWSVELAAPQNVDRQAGATDVGEEVALTATVRNAGSQDVRIHQASVRFAIGTTSVDGEYVVTRPGFPALASAGESLPMTFRVRPWATATTLQPVTVSVTLDATDLVSGSLESRGSTTSWHVMEGPDLLLGQAAYDVVPGLQQGLFNPVGVHSDGARLFIADQVNNRVLIYKPVPSVDSPTPSTVLGQPDLGVTEANSGGVSARSLNLPVNLCSDGRRLFVADTTNHRVLIWDPIPTASFTPASVILGQPTSSSNVANQEGLTARTLNLPRGVWSDGSKLFVADAGNNRVLVWNTIPTTSFAAADRVLGQPGFTSGLANAGGSPSARTLSNPRSVNFDGSRLVVCDRANNRVLIWSSLPSTNFTSADVVAGQPDFETVTAGTTSRKFSNPGCAQSDGIRLIVTDGGNNRVLIFNSVPESSNASASIVLGHSTFTAGSANDGGSVSGSVFSNPLAAFSDGQQLFVSDFSNNRVLQYTSFPAADKAVATRVIGQINLLISGANAGPILGGGRDFSGPRQAAVASGRLLVADIGSRVEIFDPVPEADVSAATVMLGQASLDGFLRNAFGLGPRSLNFASGIAVVGGRLLVSDSGNNRLLVWNSIPATMGATADTVIGQNDFTSVAANGPGVGSGSLSTPYNLAPDGDGFFVADRANNRVLRYGSVPTSPGATASVVVGQADFTSVLASAGAGRMSSPAGVAAAAGRLFVSDSGNNRVLAWNAIPASNGTLADFVLGQADFSANFPNRGLGTAGSSTFNGPIGIASDGERLAVADGSNARVLLWNTLPSQTGTAADLVVGQTDFTSSRRSMGRLTKFSLSSPEMVTLTNDSLWIGDVAHKRLLRYDLPPLRRVRVTAGRDRVSPRTASIELSAVATSRLPGPITYGWTQTAGPAATLTGTASARLGFTAAVGGAYAFSVAARDAGGVTGTASVHVLVNSAPVVPLLPDRTEANPGTVRLDASSTFDPDGDVVSFLWRGIGDSAGLPIVGANSRSASFSSSPGTTYTLQLEVDDSLGAPVTRQFRLVVRPSPVAVVSRPQLLGANQTATLDGSLSQDPDAGALTYSWLQTSGPGVTLRPTAASPIVTFQTPSADAVLGFSLTVANPRGGIATATTAVTVDGRRPTASLLFPQGQIAATKSTFLFQVDFSESMASTPAPTVAFIPGPGSRTLPGGPLRLRATDTDRSQFEFAFDAAFSRNGSYTIVISANDAQGNPLFRQPFQNTVTVDVPNRTPVALAVGPSSATAGTTLTVDGSASSDADQDPLTYAWSGTAPGGGPLTLLDGSTARPSFVPLVAGSHTIQLIVTDVNGSSSSASAFSIQVAAPGAGNRAPTASAGAAQFVAAGAGVTLPGSANDPDGDPLTVRWSLASKPPGSALPLGELPASQGGQSLTAFITPDLPGSYALVLTVTDRFQATAQSAVLVLVDDHANTPSTVGAADRLASTGGTRVATLEASGDVDVFSFPAATGTVYTASLSSVTVASAELALLDADGLSAISLGSATTTRAAQLPDYHPPAAGTLFLRVTAPRAGDKGTYRLSLLTRAAVFDSPPEVSLETRPANGGLEATVSTSGTSVPLSFFEFLTDYRSADLTLTGRIPESAASGFTVDAQQFSPPFIDTLLSATPRPRPLASGALLTLSFRVDPGSRSLDNSVGLLSVSATPPPPLARVTVLRPTADAGLSLTLATTSSGGTARLPDILDPALALQPFLRLDGRGSKDSNLPPRRLTYRWKKLSGPSAPDDPASPIPRVPLAGPGRYRFGLTVSNGVLTSPTSTVDILVVSERHPPSAVVLVAAGSSPPRDAAGGPLQAAAGQSVTLDGSSSTDLDEPDRGNLRYSWSQQEGPVRVSLPPSAVVSFTAVVEGAYAFELAVTDTNGLSSRPARAALVVRDPADGPLTLSLDAVSSSTGALGTDLGAFPEASTTAPLRVPPGAEIALQARADDRDFDAGRQTGEFSWRQRAGPAVRLAQVDTPPSRSRVTLAPVATGVYEIECQVREAASSGQELGPEATRIIRFVVENPAAPLPEARVAIRVAAKAPDTQVGQTVALDGSGSLSGGASSDLAYRWVQVQGPAVSLSNPLAAVTTFVAPVLGDDVTRQYTFQLFVDDSAAGALRSPPAAVTVVARAPDPPRPFTVPVEAGASFVAVALRPRTLGTVQELADAVDAREIAWTEGGAFRTFVKGFETLPTPLTASRAYHFRRGARTGPDLALQGVAWPPADYLVDLGAGLSLLAVPRAVAATHTTADLLELTGSAFVAYSQGRQLRVSLPGQAPVALQPEKGYLLSLPAPLRIDLNRLVRIAP